MWVIACVVSIFLAGCAPTSSYPNPQSRKNEIILSGDIIGSGNVISGNKTVLDEQEKDIIRDVEYNTSGTVIHQNTNTTSNTYTQINLASISSGVFTFGGPYDVVKRIDIIHRGNHIYILTGTLINTQIQSISIAHNNGSPFQLRKFVPGSQTFTYNISPQHANIRNGNNTYTITLTKKDKTQTVVSFSLNDVQYISTPEGYNPVYCIRDVCIDNKKRFNEKHNVLTQHIERPEYDEEIKTVFYRTRGTIIKEDREGIGYAKTTVRMSPDRFHKIVEYAGCAGGTRKQHVVDNNFRQIINPAKFFDVPASFILGNHIYYIQHLEMETSTYMYGTLPEVFEREKPLSRIDNISKILTDHALKTQFLAQTYIIEFREIPGIKFAYKTQTPQAERIFQLGTKPNLSAKGELMDINLTNQIISYYVNPDGTQNQQTGSINPFNRVFLADRGCSEYIDTDPNDYQQGTCVPAFQGRMKADRLPAFRVIPFDNNGNYLIYPIEPIYQFTTYAEMCKPVLYHYTRTPTTQNVTIHNPAYSRFTTVIPLFTHVGGWTYVSTPDGSVRVNGKTYSYLYYSLGVTDWKPARDGWIVHGSEISTFFANTLSYIGLRDKEYKDFTTYWIPEFDKNTYYFIAYHFTDALNRYIPLSFSGSQPHIHRLFMEARVVQTFDERFLYSRIGDKHHRYLLQQFVRNVGTNEVFEWGGMILKPGFHPVVR